MVWTPSEEAPQPKPQADEVFGLLTVEGGSKSGVYGTYWNVVVTCANPNQVIRATLSEKVWAKAGLPPPDSTTNVRVTARRNASGRWNVTNVEAGLVALEAAQAFVTLVEGSSAETAVAKAAVSTEGDSRSRVVTAYRFRVHSFANQPFEVRLLASVLDRCGIRFLPVDYMLTTDWRRDTGGWRLERIHDASLRALFQVAADQLPEAAGYVENDWRFDDDAKRVTVVIATHVKDVTLTCYLIAPTLRSAGVRALAAGDPVKVRLSLREGRWRIAELMAPRPDMDVPLDRETLYSVKTHLAYRETNDFGDLVNWLTIEDDSLPIAITSLSHKKLVDIDEDALVPGAQIVCDLKRGKRGWYAAKIHRIAD